jgi:uncharacterized protein (TIGR03437 family)
MYEVVFTATNSAQVAATSRVRIAVDGGQPVLTSLRNAATRLGPACSRGALARLDGRWLATATLAQPAGAFALDGTRVKVNEAYTAVVFVSPTRVDFVCPDLPAGTELAVSVENDAGTSAAITGATASITPGVFSADGSGSGQGVVHLTGTSLLATARDYRVLGQPAQPGDSITLWATGIDPNGLQPIITVGGLLSAVKTVSAVPGWAGICQITVAVPAGVPPGDAVPVRASFGPLPASSSSRSPFGSRVRSNQVTIAIEEGRR